MSIEAAREASRRPEGVMDAGAATVATTSTVAGAARMQRRRHGDAAKPGPPAAVPDLCQVGAVLRSVLFVEAVMAIGATLQADGPSSWLLLFSSATGTALPGVLLWQLAACGTRRWQVPLTAGGRSACMALLGAAAGVAGAALHAYALDEPLFGTTSTTRIVGSALAGIGLALTLHEVLRLRLLALASAQAAARLAELQSRIRPHFLFNTLNTALSLVRDDPLRAESVLEDLAELFRGALFDDVRDDIRDDVGGSRTVSLADEVALAQRYVAIEQLRFGPRLRVAWTLDPAADAARLPPLLLQPLLDNAVRHGVESAPDGGTLHVRTEARRGQAVVTVDNTVPAGTGRPGHGIALRNVRERLLLLHDIAAEFEAGLQADGRFRVRIAVPLDAG